MTAARAEVGQRSIFSDDQHAQLCKQAMFHGYMRYGSDGALSLSPVMFLRDKAELFLVVLALRL